MKKRNLFLSLFCSIVLSIALVITAVVGVVTPAKDGGSPIVPPTTDVGNVADYSEYILHNETADGSVENPYYLYNDESFITLLRAHGSEAAYFQVVEDIDFTAESGLVTLFAEDVAFNGHIDGGNHSLNNAEINVLVLEGEERSIPVRNGYAIDYTLYNAKVGLFGTIENAEIKDLVINETINVAEELFNGIVNGTVTSYYRPINEMVIGSVAAYAVDSTLNNVTVNANVNANAFASVSDEGKVQGFNAVGGVVGVADGTTISNSEVNVTMDTDTGLNYKFNSRTDARNNADKNFVGGVAGYLIEGSEVINTNVNFDLTAHYAQESFIGGVAGYVKNSTITSDTVSEVTLNIHESREERAFEAGENLKADNVDGLVSWVGGVACMLDSNTTISNITVGSEVEFDCVFGGIYTTVYYVNQVDSTENITITDVVVDAKVDAQKVFGVARYAGENTTFSFGRTETENVNGEVVEYVIRLESLSEYGAGCGEYNMKNGIKTVAPFDDSQTLAFRKLGKGRVRVSRVFKNQMVQADQGAVLNDTTID